MSVCVYYIILTVKTLILYIRCISICLSQMPKNSPQPRYTWEISIQVNDGRDFALCEGPVSEKALGNLFAMWIKNRGDLSQWSDAGLFGGIVNKYSDLTPSEVSVWLGLSPEELSTPEEVDDKLIEYHCTRVWKLRYDCGNRMKITRSFES